MKRNLTNPDYEPPSKRPKTSSDTISFNVHVKGRIDYHTVEDATFNEHGFRTLLLRFVNVDKVYQIAIRKQDIKDLYKRENHLSKKRYNLLIDDSSPWFINNPTGQTDTELLLKESKNFEEFIIDDNMKGINVCRTCTKSKLGFTYCDAFNPKIDIKSIHKPVSMKTLVDILLEF